MFTFLTLMSIPVLTKTATALAAAFFPTPLLDLMDSWSGPVMLSLYSVAFLSALLVSLFSPQALTLTSGLLAGLVSSTVMTVSTSRD